MPFEWFVALRYLREGRGQSVLILAAVTVGVAVIVFLSALIGGLEVGLLEKTLGSQSHITVLEPREVARPLVEPSPGVRIARVVQPAPQRLRSINQWPDVLRQVEATEGVIAVSPMVNGAGFAVRADATSPILVLGVDPQRFARIIDVPRRMVLGRFDVEGGRVSIGSTLAADLGVGLGDKLRVRTTEGVEDVVTVAGVFTLGNEAVDRTWVVTSLRHAQSLFMLPGGATLLQVKVSDVYAAERIAVDIHEATGLEARSWMAVSRDLLSALSSQRSSKYMIQFFVVMAVALGIASVLIVSVVQKSREIGILRAVGTPRRRVLVVFLLQGGLLGLTGSITGCALGAAISKGIEHLTLNPDGTARFIVQLNAPLFLSTSLLATGVGLLAALIPALRASRLDPAASIRHG